MGNRLVVVLFAMLQSLSGPGPVARADSFLAPSVRIVGQTHGEQALMLDVELVHPGIRQAFTGILLEIICDGHGAPISRLVLVGLQQNRASDRARVVGLSVADELVLPESLKPGQVRRLQIRLPETTDPETGTCTRIAVRGAW